MTNPSLGEVTELPPERLAEIRAADANYSAADMRLGYSRPGPCEDRRDLLAEVDRLRAEHERLRAALADLARPGPAEMRMDAYWYGFERTGVGIIDMILSAVAQAGKACHHTDSWRDHYPKGTPSQEEWIQQAAEDAADLIRSALDGPA